MQTTENSPCIVARARPGAAGDPIPIAFGRRPSRPSGGLNGNTGLSCHVGTPLRGKGCRAERETARFASGDSMDVSNGSAVFKDIGLNVGNEEVLRRLRMTAAGYRHSNEMRELFHATLEFGRRLIAPAAVCVTRELLSIQDDMIRFRETDFHVRSGGVAALLEGCKSATLMAATIGPGLSAAADELMAGKRMTEAMILDAFGSEAVEGAVNSLCRLLRESEVGREFVTTKRFSPGYGDWDLSAQRDVLKELGAARIGISVSGSLILIPEKSITAIMGWKPKG